jgi:hypothetical protein
MTPQGPPCRPGCGEYCLITDWRWILDDELPSPPAWRLAWAIVGIPNPMPGDEYRTAFEAFEVTYGLRELMRRLRMAANQPTMNNGWTAACRGRVVDLLDRYEQHVRRATAS